MSGKDRGFLDKLGMTRWVARNDKFGVWSFSLKKKIIKFTI